MIEAIGMSDLKAKISNLPSSPGVYLLKDADERIIYVGKASSLRRRVASYLREREGKNPRLTQLRSRIADVDFIVTANEVEALILEANLIKRYLPAYNVVFRDDKSYPYLVICMQDEFPRIMFARGRRYSGALYYGPFAHAGAVRETIDTLRKVFPFRSCRGKEPGKNTGAPCLDYHIKLCSGPCAGAVSRDDYRRIIEGVREFLEGKHDKILKDLESRMREESERQEYEQAARTRDKINALNRLLQRQQAHSLKQGDQDIFSVFRDELAACVTVFYIRGGKILGKQDFFTQLPVPRDEGEILAALLPQFYSRTSHIPREVVLSHPFAREEKTLMEEWLSDKAGRKVKIEVPVKGKKKSLVEKVMENARHGLEVHLAKQASDLGWISRALNGIYEGLGLENLPYRIECYDISNLGSEDAVGSMVVYEGGIPKRKDFRRFQIKGVGGQNDVAMIEEVITRRISKLGDAAVNTRYGKGGSKDIHKDSFLKRPDLLLIDGGEPQLAAAMKALQKLKIEEIGVAALAKKMEEIYMPGRRGAVCLPRDSEALRMLQRIRDEAHRYALTYHRLQRDKRARRSALDDIPGIGPKRKKYLMRHYGSLAGIAAASLEELQGLSFLDKKTAANVYSILCKSSGQENNMLEKE
jgi:excinuclease ABC subunit C